MHKLDAVIFDFDGTLAELTIDLEFMKTKIAALGEVFMDERPTPCETPALEWLEELVQQVMKRDRDEALEFRSRGRLVIAAMEMDAAREGRLFEYTRPTFEVLKQHGIAAGVITRNISAAVRVVFPDIEEVAQVFIPRETARSVKPNPAHLIQALDVVGVKPENALMVGDHPMDIQTGRAAGSLCAAVTSGAVSESGFESARPDFLAPDVGELMDHLAAQGLV